jgi:hypothetical protein
LEYLCGIQIISLAVLAPDVLKVIEWTEDLEAIFKSNYEQDPSLSWQYFGSSSGIMRQYPGVQRCLVSSYLIPLNLSHTLKKIFCRQIKVLQSWGMMPDSFSEATIQVLHILQNFGVWHAVTMV